jgi:phosphoserine aminotransferase
VNERLISFAAGPAALPLPVLLEVQRDLVSLPGVGASALEVSHRGPWFEGVIDEAERNLRDLLQIPDTHAVVYCQGGATQQFSMVPMNFLRGDSRVADYLVTGSWGEKAVQEAERQGAARMAWSGAGEDYARVPTDAECAAALWKDAAYVHMTSNETIQGVEWHEPPSPPEGVPLIADISSAFLSRPVDVARFGLIYAGAQKNAGPAGVTVAIVDRTMLARIPDGLPTMLDYRTFVEGNSMFNTPPVFSIYVLMLVTRWLRDDVGGLEKQWDINRQKASLLYDEIDGSGGFYRGHAAPTSRSLMNVTWRLPSEALEKTFVAEAADRGMVELRGHRSVGGIRASIYNAMPIEGVQTLAAFMHAFAVAHA